MKKDGKIENDKIIVNGKKEALIKQLNPMKEIIDNKSMDKIISQLNRSKGLEIIKDITPIYNEIAKNVFDSIDLNLSPLSKTAISITEALKPMIEQITSIIPSVSLLYAGMAEAMEKIRKDPYNSEYWIECSDKLSEYMWAIPYDISSVELMEILKKTNSETEFDNCMLDYFDKEKTRKIFADISSLLEIKHAEIFKQIEKAYYDKSYALANVGLLSIIDGICTDFLLDRGCSIRKNFLLPIIEVIEKKSNNPAEIVPIRVLSNNLNKLYEDIKFNGIIDISTNKKIRRHPSHHGQDFPNEKIDTLVLLNTLYYLLVLKYDYIDYLSPLVYIRNQTDMEQYGITNCKEFKRFYAIKKDTNGNK